MDGFRQDPTVTAIEVDVAMGYFTGLQFVTALQLSTHRLKPFCGALRHTDHI